MMSDSFLASRSHGINSFWGFLAKCHSLMSSLGFVIVNPDNACIDGEQMGIMSSTGSVWNIPS